MLLIMFYFLCLSMPVFCVCIYLNMFNLFVCENAGPRVRAAVTESGYTLGKKIPTGLSVSSNPYAFRLLKHNSTRNPLSLFFLS